MFGQTISNDETVAGGENPLLAGRYRVVRQLGTGGMGSVWLAEDTLLDNKQFAIKMLPSILMSNKRAYRQLKDEALVAMRLVHPNIVQIRAFAIGGGNPFLVMDYIDGQTLDDYLAEKGRLSEEEVIKVLRPIAAALDYAHAKGVVHRDVKPGNVMIAKDGTPYILDFGIAREIQETMTRVTGKLSSGTLLYMSPEQLNGEKPTPAQDIYSFAAMAYECLKGEPPFVRGAIEDQIKNKLPEPLISTAVENDGRPMVGLLAAGVMAGLAKKSGERPITCTAVLKEHIPSPQPDIQSVSEKRPRSCSPLGVQQEVPKPADLGKTIPEEDRRYLPPDVRRSLENGRTTSDSNDGNGGQGNKSDDRQFAQVNPFVRNGPVRNNDVGIGVWTWIGVVAVILIACCGIAYKVSWQWQNNTNTSYYSNSQRTRDKETAERCRAEAEYAMSNARQNNAQELCPDEWKEAESAWLIATAEFARREYDKAKGTFAKSSTLFWKCANKAKNVASPERGIAPKPKIYLTATLDGVPKPALITGGLQENNKYKTPLNVDINAPLGSKGEFTVEHFENGVKYVGKGGYTVREGVQNVNVELSRPRPATMNFCPYCAGSLKEFDKIGMKCPFCRRNL